MRHIVNDVYSVLRHANHSHRLNVKGSETFLEGERLGNKFVDPHWDVASFDLPRGLYLPNFPAKPRTTWEMGEEVFVIGNPYLSGANIRRGHVSDFDGISDKQGTEDDLYLRGGFGVDMGVTGGDSGTPLVSRDFRLLGLVSSGSGFTGYIQDMGRYLGREGFGEGEDIGLT